MSKLPGVLHARAELRACGPQAAAEQDGTRQIVLRHVAPCDACFEFVVWQFGRCIKKRQSDWA